MPNQVDTSEEGLERLRAAVRANPRSTTFVALAHRLCEAGRAAEAEDVCREGLSRHPGLVTGQVALGRALLDRGRLREAQEVLIAAAKANPDHGDAFRWLGELAIKRRDLPRARVLLEYAEELSPNDRRVTELLIQAGGTPNFRLLRPRTDYEHTRVSNARALADRMHEDPAEGSTRGDSPIPAAQSAERPDPAKRRGDGGARAEAAPGSGLVDDPTVVDGQAALQAWKNAAHDPDDIGPSIEVESDRILVPRAGELTVDSRSREPAPNRLALVEVSPDADRTPAGVRSSLPVPVRRTLSALRDAGTARSSRNRKLLIAGGLGAAALLGVVLVLVGRRESGVLGEQRAKLSAALSAGTLKSLTDARALAGQILAAAPDDGDTLARLTLVDALLVTDYGLPPPKDSRVTLARALTAGGSSGMRLGTLEASCALLSLGAGQLGKAQECAERALAAFPEGAPVLLASARVKAYNADLDGARRDLERLLQRAPDFSTAVLDWAAIWIDLGDPSTAAQSLRDQLKRTSDHLRARLLLTEAERALGDRGADDGLEAACREQSKQSPTLRVGCLLAASAQARLAGERQQALRSARAAITDMPDDPRLLATAATSLAILGDIDAADQVLVRARRLARESVVSLAWADISVRLGRRQAVVPGKLLEAAAGPERRLVTARLVLSYEGPAGLAKHLKTVPRGLVLIDPDLHTISQLAEEGAARVDRTDLEKRIERGDPVAAYVLGRLLEHGEPRQAVRRLEKALWGHGDACDAAVIYRNALRQLDMAPSLRLLRELRLRNGQCPAAQI